MKISEIVLGGTKKRLHRDPRKRRHIRNDNLYTANPKDLSEGEVKQSFALKVLTNIAARRDNSPFPVKFYDGSVLKVNPVTAKRFLSYYDESDAEKQHWILNYLKTKKGFLELMQPEFIESIEENIDEVIRKVGDKFRLYSKKGKNLGTYDSRAGAEKREKQVNYFKHMSEGYKLQLERDPNMYVLHILDIETGKRTEVRGKSDYETTGYDANDKLHQLLDKIGKSANIAELINGEVVTINPKHPDAEKAKAATDVAFNEAKGGLGLTIFDIDETLMRTTAKVKIVKDGKVIKTLDNQHFNDYQLQPGEQFDFGEFKNAEKFNRESIPIEPMIAKLKAIINNAGNSKVIMLTARSDFDNKELFLSTFKDLGIDMSRIHVHRAGNLPGSPAANKEVWIRRYLDTGKYARVRLYDDALSNIKMFNALSDEYPDIQFFPYLVSHEGTIKTIREETGAEKAKAATDVAFNEAKEIEFVCVNPKFCDATDPKNQEALFQSLKQVPGIIVYRQDFQVHNSMAAILKSSADRNTVKQIKQLAKKHNVGIDLENNVSDRFIDSLYTDSAPNIIDWYDSDHINEGTVKEETGVEMLKIFRNMHHDTARNKEMDAFIKAHEWELRDFTPDMFPSEEEFFDYDDPFDRIIDIDYNHRVDLSQPIIVGPQYSDGKYSVIDGNHRAARAQQLGKTIKGYFPVKATTEGVAREPDPEGYRKTALTAPANTLVIDTKSDLDWYKLGQYISNLNTDDPHEFGQSDSDMVITAANAEQLNKLKRYLDKAGAAYKEISGTHDQPELHTENKRGR